MLRTLFAAALFACSIVFTSQTALAQQPTPEQIEARIAALKKIADSLDYRQGEIELKSGMAKIHVPAEFRYLGPKDTETVLTQLWGNPPGDQDTLGMLVPAETGPMERNSWGVIITYDDDGYVKDDDAATIDYAELLEQMKKDSLKANEMRVKEGYPRLDLVGWATPPRYDQAAKKLYWAKELKSEDADENTLNYNIRVLGRSGVLVLNAVAAMSQLAEIEKAAPTVLGMVEFKEGHRYADFNAATDKVATYGLAALVTGGVLAKGGFFKVLIGTVMAFKKFAILGAIALLVGLKSLLGKLFGRRASDEPPLRG